MHKIIFINGRFLTQPVTGVQRYAIEMFRSLDQLLTTGGLDSKGIDLICLVPPDCTNDPDWKRIQVCSIGSRTGNLWEQIDLPWHVRRSLLFSPANIGPYFHPNQVVTIHDASVYAFPQAYSFSFRTKYRLTYQRMASTAQKIITVSEFSKQELVRYCGMRPERLTVIPHGCEHLANINPDENVLSRTSLQGKRYFLGVGSQSPHKNFRGLVEAFRKLNRDDVNLALVGGKFSKVFQSSEEDLPPNAQYLGYVKDAELRALYQNAAGFVFPSFYEGFGIPVLEAMYSGCPVICSQTASLPEAGGQAALYCDPCDPEDIANKMAALLDSPSLREELHQAGYQQVQKFSWQNAAIETWHLLCTLI